MGQQFGGKKRSNDKHDIGLVIGGGMIIMTTIIATGYAYPNLS